MHLALRHSVTPGSSTKFAPTLPGASEPKAQAPEVSSTPDALRVVAIGGGTGLSTLLRGLRRHVAFPDWPTQVPCHISDLAAVVTVTDDGGSSGRLRQEF